ncbi:TPA: YSIRK-type signal peptide-containing protein, partial [Streptococcus suis]|nr:YSIRK-type signal peptide-containing protein [Streptococcus suis]
MNRQDKNYQKLYQYSIRKRNWGVGSVVVGVFLAGMLQAPTVLANSGVAATGPTIENQAGAGAGVVSDSEVTPHSEATTPSSLGENETRTVEQPSGPSENTAPSNEATLDPKYVLGESVPLEVSKEKITVTSDDNAAWQNSRGVQNLLNGDYGDASADDNYVLTELKWDKSKSLPQEVTFTFADVMTLEHLEVYKRPSGLGNLTKLAVTVLGENDSLLSENVEVSIGRNDVSKSYSLAEFPNLKKVKIRFLEAVNDQGQVENRALTVKGVSFFEKSPIRGEKVQSSTLSISGTDSAYQNGQGVTRLLDGKISLKTELKWDNSGSLPQTFTISPTDGNPVELTGVSIYKRPGGWGSLKKFTLVTKKDGAQVQSIDVDVLQDATLSNVVLNGSSVDAVEITVKEAFNPSGATVTNQLSLREVVLYKKAPLPLPEEETPGNENDANTGSGNTTSPDTNSSGGSTTTPDSNAGSGNTTSPDTNSGGGTTTTPDSNVGAGSSTNPDTNSGSGTTTTPDSNAGSGNTTNPDTNSGGGTTTTPDSNAGSGNTTSPDTNSSGGTTTTPDSNAGSGNTTSPDTNSGGGTTTTPDSNAGEKPQPTTPVVATKAIVPVSAEKFTIEGNRSHYQNTPNYVRVLDNLLNGDIGESDGFGEYLTELKWDGGPSLPVTVGFQLNTPQELDSVVIHKRLNNNGALTHYKVRVHRDSQEVFESDVIETPTSENDATYDLSSFGVVNKVELVFTQTVSNGGAVNPKHLTLKGVSFFEKSPVIEGEKLNQSDFQATVEQPDKYHNGRGIDKLLDDNNSSLAEYHWTAPKNLPEVITITPKDGEARSLSGFTLHKRAGQGGSVTKYSVTTYRNDTVVQETGDIEVPYNATYSHFGLNGEEVDKVVLVVKEAKNRNGNPVTNELTLRGFTLYEKVDMPIAEPPA